MSKSPAPRQPRAAAPVSPTPKLLVAGLCSLLLGACSEPFIVLPGDALQGEVTDPPTDWNEVADIDIVQFETRPDDPYSINLWMVVLGPDIYVATGEDGTNWTAHIADNPDTRIKIGNQIYELSAMRINNPEEQARVASAYVDKYDLDAEDNWVMEGQVFRLDRH